MSAKNLCFTFRHSTSYNSREVNAMKDIGKNIRQIRARKNITQEALAEALFVSRQTVSNYETGRSRPDIHTLMQIAKILDTDMDSILYGPPMPEELRRARKCCLPSAIVFAVLTVFYFSLSPLCYELASVHYIVLPRSLMQLLVRPAVYFTLGWLLCRLGMAFCKLRPLAGKVALGLRRGLTILLCVCGAILLPLLVLYTLAFIRDLSGGNYELTLSIPVYNQVSFALYYVLTKCPAILTPIGALLSACTAPGDDLPK